MGIAEDSFFEIFGFADIEDAVEVVMHLVDAGRFRNGSGEVLDDGDTFFCVFGEGRGYVRDGHEKKDMKRSQCSKRERRMAREKGERRVEMNMVEAAKFWAVS